MGGQSQTTSGTYEHQLSSCKQNVVLFTLKIGTGPIGTVRNSGQDHKYVEHVLIIFLYKSKTLGYSET